MRSIRPVSSRRRVRRPRRDDSFGYLSLPSPGRMSKHAPWRALASSRSAGAGTSARRRWHPRRLTSPGAISDDISGDDVSGDVVDGLGPPAGTLDQRGFYSTRRASIRILGRYATGTQPGACGAGRECGFGSAGSGCEFGRRAQGCRLGTDTLLPGTSAQRRLTCRFRPRCDAPVHWRSTCDARAHIWCPNTAAQRPSGLNHRGKTSRPKNSGLYRRGIAPM